MSEPILTSMSRAAGFDLVNVEPSRSMIRNSEAGSLSFHENDGDTDHALFVNVVAALLANIEIPEEDLHFSGFMKHVDNFVTKVDTAVEDRLMLVLRQPRFREIERNWLMLSQIVGA